MSVYLLISRLGISFGVSVGISSLGISGDFHGCYTSVYIVEPHHKKFSRDRGKSFLR